MWYVVQVRVGTEEKIRLQCEKKIAEDILESCFIPYYEARRKSAGEWKTEQKILFPGYVFTVTECAEELFLALKKIDGLTKLLGVGNDMVPISPEEEKMLRRLSGEDHVMEMSEGIMEGTRVIVRSGPLMGQEGYIKKVDRHKRKAWLELPLFGRLQTVEVGLEITMKTV